MKTLITIAALTLLVSACKHPLQIVGEGDIVELNNGARGCTLEQFQAADSRCTDNEVQDDYDALYQALPRPGWRFVSWNGACGAVPRGQCKVAAPASLISWWDMNFPGLPVSPLIATFARGETVSSDRAFIGSAFGIDDFEAFSLLLRANLYADGRFDYQTVLESTVSVEDFGAGYYQREADGLVLLSSNNSDYSSGGAATAAFDLMALVDFDYTDGEISVALLTEALSGAGNSLLNGSYYCGFIDTDPAGSFAQVTLDGNGSGSVSILENTYNQVGSAPLTYSVAGDGSVTVNYAGYRVVGGVATNGDFIALTQTMESDQGAGMCVKTSSGKSLVSVAGNYYGVFASTAAATAVAELSVAGDGSASGSILADSYGNSNVPAVLNPVSVQGDGRLVSGGEQGMISPDGRVGFLVNASGGQPELTVYIRKSN